MALAMVCGLGAGAGCVGGGYVYEGGYGYGGYAYGTPGLSLAYVSDGVWVLEDQPYPIFYSNGLYWLYRDGYWFRSDYYRRNWRDWRHVHVRGVPYGVRRIHHPRRYARYYARPGVRVRYGPTGRIYVRDRRQYQQYLERRHRRYYPESRYYDRRRERYRRDYDRRYRRDYDRRYRRDYDRRYRPRDYDRRYPRDYDRRYRPRDYDRRHPRNHDRGHR